MGDLLKLIWHAVTGLLRPRAALQTEILVLRHQLNVLRRRAPKRVAVSNIDRPVFAGLIGQVELLFGFASMTRLPAAHRLKA
jgi:hypothetical protein